ncbi:lipoyl(octanoyl) transferase LipB [Proteinivorax hydrogeniformans]|uniref:Octanoyltransferase n=1 Tax=Proteinivorax hydrogeniformans TaxID=1826727 RepID=A0AAU8HRR4_9FIRM
MDERLRVISLGKCRYKKALAIQHELLEKRQKGDIGDTLILVEHPPVITTGRNASKSNIIASKEYLSENGIELIETNRGGDVTYHGDGQLVGYPIFNLEDNKLGVRQFVEKLEQVFIDLLTEKYDVNATRHEQHRGVWVGNEKVVAIGIAVKQGVTMHGFAMNINTNLEHFKLIIPCGLAEMGVTSLQKQVGEKVDFQQASSLVLEKICDTFEFNSYEKIERN